MRVNECVSKEFLYLMLLSDDVQSYCDLHAHGVAQRGIRMADLKEYKFVLPENKIIDSFTTMVEPIIEKTQFLRKSINHAAESRDRLLPKLMNGELEV
jgi:type I restriction enzyme S subunit